MVYPTNPIKFSRYKTAEPTCGCMRSVARRLVKKTKIIKIKGGCMYTYDLLENGCHYLVKEKEDSPIALIKVAVETDHCLFIQRFDDPTQTEWKLKKDMLFDIVECLSDEAVKAWEEHYTSEDAYYEEEDDE